MPRKVRHDPILGTELTSYVKTIGDVIEPVVNSATTFQVNQSDGTNVFNVDTTNARVGIGTAEPNTNVHIKKDFSGITAARVENANIIGESDASAQEQFVLGPIGSEHLILQVLSDSHATLPRKVLFNTSTHDFFFRLSSANVVKVWRGALADSLSIKSNGVGIGIETAGAQLHVVSPTAATKGLIVKGASSQSANLQEWQISDGTVIAQIGPSGTAATLTLTGSAQAQVDLKANGNTWRQIATETGYQWADATAGKTFIQLTTHANFTSSAAIRFREGGVNIWGSTTSGSAHSLLVVPRTTATKGVIVKGLASQSANLQEWQDSNGAVLAGVDERGVLFCDLNTGVTNTYLGDNAGNAAGTGISNVGIGSEALVKNTSGTQNMALGAAALDANTGGSYNSAIGQNSLTTNIGGSSNTAIGVQALRNNTEGDGNTSIGLSSTHYSQTGNNNTVIGLQAGFGVVSNSFSNNTIIGYQAGFGLSTGGSNIFIGNLAASKQTTLSNLLVIDNQARADVATELTNSILYGVMAAAPADQTLRVNADLQILDANTYFKNNGGDLDLYTAANKTLELQTVVYNDIYIPLAGAKVPASNAPTWAAFDTNLNSYTFALNDYTDLATAEIVHDYKEGTDIEIHVHFVTNGANDGTERKVKYQVFYSWGDVGETMTGEATANAEETIVASEADRTHHRLSITTITGTNYKINSALKIRLKRIAGTGTEPASDPFVEMVGIHYQIDTLGSRQQAVK